MEITLKFTEKNINKDCCYIVDRLSEAGQNSRDFKTTERDNVENKTRTVVVSQMFPP